MIIVKIRSGLGNQLFQYAYARSLKERGYEVFLDFDAFNVFYPCDKYSYTIRRRTAIHKFNISLNSIDVQKDRHFRYVKQLTEFDKKIFQLAKRGLWPYKYYEEDLGFSKHFYNPPKNCYIEGCFQNTKYFAEIRTILLSELTLKEDYFVSDKLKRILDLDESVSLHIRRGDYIKYGMALPILYYERAIEKIKEYYNDPHLLVFSDDIDWVKNHFRTDVNCDYIFNYGNYSDYQELMLMTRCKSNIISNSTFSWWGAWLNNNPDKIVVAPTRWFGDQKDLALPEWEII